MTELLYHWRDPSVHRCPVHTYFCAQPSELTAGVVAITPAILDIRWGDNSRTSVHYMRCGYTSIPVGQLLMGITQIIFLDMMPCNCWIRMKTCSLEGARIFVFMI